MKCYFKKYQLHFKRPAGTSRGVMYDKDTYFIIIEDKGQFAFGECNLFKGLSADERPDYEEKLTQVCQQISKGEEISFDDLAEWPSILFGVETVLKDHRNGCKKIIFPSDFIFSKGSIPINGLIWMGDTKYMLAQIEEKLKDGFSCLKMKIGAINFENELEIIKSIREKFSLKEIELRVDANGAFSKIEAIEKLNRLAEYDIHSIEQPITTGDWDSMAEVVQNSPIPVALDEELIGIFSTKEKEVLIKKILPPYIILKPALVGGFSGCDKWIRIAEASSVQWWITSALESNIGLNAIAQYTFTKNNPLPQGLGTGKLYTNNFDSPLRIENGALWYGDSLTWNTNVLTHGV